MRYRWNRHHSYIVNIVFVNNLVQKQTFFIFCIFVFIRYKGSPLGRVSLDRLYKSQRHGTNFLTACATADLKFEGFWPRVQLQILISRGVDRVCKSSAPVAGRAYLFRCTSFPFYDCIPNRTEKETGFSVSKQSQAPK